MAIVPDFYWKQHDTAPVIQSTLKDATGAVINCDGGLGVRGFQKPAGGEDL